MKLQFQKKEVSCLRSPMTQVQNLEQTQELRIPEGMPGVARILGSWGQVLVRSKEWNRDSIRVSGGVQVWVLYEPEDGSQQRSLECWIPFQMNWDLPEDTPEGRFQMRPLLRYVDARTVSAGKVIIRAGIGMLIQCWCPHSVSVYQPEESQAAVELLSSRWPVRLPREAGEKAFEVEEQLSLPGSAPLPEKLVYYRLDPVITDRKVLGNRIVFRGSGNLHVLYRCEEGRLYSWNFELPFSQYTELEEEYSADASADVTMAVTQLELEPNGEGKLNLRAGLTGQYLVDDRQILETVEDAYSPRQELNRKQEMLELPVLLENRREMLLAEQTVPAEGETVVDTALWPDFPRQRREGDSVTLEQTAPVQILYYDGTGRLQSAQSRWETSAVLNADAEAKMMAVPQVPETQVTAGQSGIHFRGELPVQVFAMAQQSIPMVTELETGERKEPDPARPSLILRRANRRLWDLARENGSTVAAIQEANGISGEPEYGKMLLIPIM